MILAVRQEIRTRQTKLEGSTIRDQIAFAELNQRLWSLTTDRAIRDGNIDLAATTSLREIEYGKSVARLAKLEKVDLLRQLHRQVELQDDARRRFHRIKEEADEERA